MNVIPQEAQLSKPMEIQTSGASVCMGEEACYQMREDIVSRNEYRNLYRAAASRNIL